ncbi:hypothetical protein HPP92_023002 [Vanilla planifolia]|uniref:Uncharacterized protein n=1 Tax=Vanilla planifolia TaxID=51239 RepID=A0A835PUB3_VANPL|nr:hypothetical protein HPP92_023268 [Vanilla planifolia]KAG0459874.1 hypothetical protein HPP92_023002 [Vanilla planifolia]
MAAMPAQPCTNMNSEERPSMMYWPLTRPGRKNTGRTTSVRWFYELAIPGRSTIRYKMRPETMQM